MICKPGFKTLISQIYAPDDKHIDSDVQFGVTRALIGNYLRHDEPAPELGFGISFTTSSSVSATMKLSK